MDEVRVKQNDLPSRHWCVITCDDVNGDRSSHLEPDQCCRACLCCKQKCGFISMVIVSAAQVALITTAGVKTFAFGCENLAVTGLLILIFWSVFRRHVKASIDLCCRAALTAICGFISYFVGSLANYLPIEGYLVSSVIVVGLCFGSCYMFLRAETWARVFAEAALLHGAEKESKEGGEEVVKTPSEPCLYPPRMEDGGVSGDLDFPGYHMPAITGLGSWRFSGARITWSVTLISMCLFLGMLAGLMDMAGDLALLANMKSVLSVTAAVFLKAFFRDALMMAIFYYIMCCYVRALRRRQDWKIGEVLLMTVWLSTSVGMFQNTVFVMTGSLDTFLITQFSPWVRGLVVVPGHCFPALVITLGVVQMYTVKRRMRDSLGMLMVHFWVAVLMFTGFNWLINLTGIVSDLQSYAVCIFLSLFVNPAIFVSFYWKWKRERHYPETPDQLMLPSRVLAKARISRMNSNEVEDEENADNKEIESSKSEKSDLHQSDDSNDSNTSVHSDDNTRDITIHTDTELEMITIN